MLNANEARALVEKAYPGAITQDCFVYNDIFLVRVQHPDSDEGDYDPYMSVDPMTGIVKEFSIITDGDPAAILEAFQNRGGV